MDRTQLLQHFDTLAETPEAVAKLRTFIYDLAIHGNLLAQDRADEPASSLLTKIRQQKQKTENGAAQRPKPNREQTELDNPFAVPDGWEWAILSSVALRIHYGYTASAIHGDTGVRLLRITDIQDGQVNWNGVPGCSISDKEIPKYELRENDVLIARTGGTIGKSFLVRGVTVRAVFASYLIRVIPSDLFCADYLSVFLSSSFYWEQLRDNSAGTGQPNVNGEALSHLLLPVPPLAEQRRIVAKVEELLALCDELEARQTAAREQRTRLVRSALDHLTTAKDESDFKKHSAFCLQHSELLFDSVPALRQAILSLAVQGRLVPHEKKHDQDIECVKPIEVFPIPYAWQWVTFEALTESAFTGLERSKAEQSPDREYAYMKMNNITPEGGCDLTAVIRVDASSDELAKHQLQPGDFLFNTRNSFELVGKTCVFQPNRKDVFLFNNNMLKVSFIDGVDQQFINLWCCSPIGRSELTKLKSATTNVAAIYQGKLATLPVPLPPLAEQQRIVAKVDELLRWCDALEARLTAAQTTATHLLDATLHQILAN